MVQSLACCFKNDDVEKGLGLRCGRFKDISQNFSFSSVECLQL